MDNNYKNEMETLTKNYKHKICFRQKRKGNIYISCACTNARLPSLAEECRGWSLLEIQTAREVCDARGLIHRQEEPLSYYPKWTLQSTSLLRYMRRLCCIQSGVSAGAEKTLRYKRHYVTIQLRYIRHFRDTRKDFDLDQKFRCDLGLSGTSLYPIDTTSTSNE